MVPEEMMMTSLSSSYLIFSGSRSSISLSPPPLEMAYAAARLVASFQTFNSDMSTDKDAVLLPSVMKAPNLRSGPASSLTSTSSPPRTAAIPAPCPQNPATRLPPFGVPAKTWCRWHRKVPANLRGLRETSAPCTCK